MGIYQERILPRITHAAMNRSDLAPIRDRVCGGLAGEVVEIGFGSGLNVPHYPPAVVRVRAVDPAVLGQRLAASRVAATLVPVEYTGLDGRSLPLESDSVDHVLSTWTLCTIPDLERALAEVRRVLRPGGFLNFVEHGKSPDSDVARWQDRLTPVQRRMAGGCHLNRPISQLLAGSGLKVEAMENYYVKGPKTFGYTFEGRARKA